MSPKPKTPEPHYYIPAKRIQLPDGSTLIKPGKAIQRCKTSEASRMLGIHTKVLHALADCGLITRASPSPGSHFFYPAEVEAFIRQTEADPDYWTRVRRIAYLKGQTLRESQTR